MWGYDAKHLLPLDAELPLYLTVFLGHIEGTHRSLRTSALTLLEGSAFCFARRATSEFYSLPVYQDILLIHVCVDR
jgi:hypothetical protein